MSISNYFSSSLSASSNINLNKDPAVKISFQINFKPFQPILKFPVKNSRSFNKKWYDSFQWLEYSITETKKIIFNLMTPHTLLPRTILPYPTFHPSYATVDNERTMTIFQKLIMNQESGLFIYFYHLLNFFNLDGVI
jgi:hypothetical protein